MLGHLFKHLIIFKIIFHSFVPMVDEERNHYLARMKRSYLRKTSPRRKDNLEVPSGLHLVFTFARETIGHVSLAVLFMNREPV